MRFPLTTIQLSVEIKCNVLRLAALEWSCLGVERFALFSCLGPSPGAWAWHSVAKPKAPRP